MKLRLVKATSSPLTGALETTSYALSAGDSYGEILEAATKGELPFPVFG